MRSDMWKVIVERPRTGGGFARALGRRPRKLARGDLEGDSLGVIERTRRTKHLNENLAPLRRFLERQVGRPWDNVYAEIRAAISFDNEVQRHVLAHIDQFLWRNVRIERGRIYTLDRFGWLPRRGVLYVDPRTGIIRKARRIPDAPARPRDDLVALGPNQCLLRIEGAWFEVTLARVPADPQRAFDVVTRAPPVVVQSYGRSQAAHPYGAPLVYAAHKRQLSKRELRAHRQAGRIR